MGVWWRFDRQSLPCQRGAPGLPRVCIRQDPSKCGEYDVEVVARLKSKIDRSRNVAYVRRYVSRMQHRGRNGTAHMTRQPNTGLCKTEPARPRLSRKSPQNTVIDIMHQRSMILLKRMGCHLADSVWSGQRVPDGGEDEAESGPGIRCRTRSVDEDLPYVC